jgi:hypothetical protein
MGLIRSILDMLFFIILLISIINSFNFSYLLLLMLLLWLLLLLNLWRLNLIALLSRMSLLSQSLLLFNSWYEIPWMIIILLKWILVILLLSIIVIWWIKRSESLWCLNWLNLNLRLLSNRIWISNLRMGLLTLTILSYTFSRLLSSFEGRSWRYILLLLLLILLAILWLLRVRNLLIKLGLLISIFKLGILISIRRLILKITVLIVILALRWLKGVFFNTIYLRVILDTLVLITWRNILLILPQLSLNKVTALSVLIKCLWMRMGNNSQVFMIIWMLKLWHRMTFIGLNNDRLSGSFLSYQILLT